MNRYEVWYGTAAGERIALIHDVAALEYVKVYGDVGVASIAFPRRSQVYDSNEPDRRLYIYRRPQGGSLSLEMVCFLGTFNTSTDANGLTMRESTGYDGNDLLRRRVVAFYAGSSEADKSDYADDMMKEIVSENLAQNDNYSASAPDPSRDLSTYLSVAADLSDGASLEKGMSWRNVLTVLQDLQAASKTDGTEVFFGVVPIDESDFEFRTWTGQPGSDRTSSSSSPIIFSLEWGNLAAPNLRYEYADSENAVYAGGRGDESNRLIALASDSDRAGVSPFGLREGFTNATRATTSAGVQDIANDELTRRRPQMVFSGTLLDTPLTPYGGAGWNVGDKVTVSYAGRQFDTIIRSVHVRLSARGGEQITARVEDTVTL